MATLKSIFFTRKSGAFDLLTTCSVHVVLQGRAHDAGLENDPEAEEFWHISDAELFPYELTFMDCAWDGRVTQLARSRLKRRGSGIITMKPFLFVKTFLSRGRANSSTLTTASDKRRPSRLTWSNSSLCMTMPPRFPRSGDFLHMERGEAKDARPSLLLRMAIQDQLETWEPCCLESGTVSQWRRWAMLLGNMRQDQSQSAIDVDVVSDLLENAWEARGI